MGEECDLNEEPGHEATASRTVAEAADDLLEAERRAVEMGIDLTLLDARMAMTPAERVHAHESATRLAQALAKAMEAKRERDREAGRKAD